MSLFRSFDEDNQQPNLARPATTMAGDVIAESRSLYAGIRGAGVPVISEPDQDRPGPKMPVLADGETVDKTVARVGALGDPWQLDSDPTGDMTVAFGRANGQPTTNTDILSLNIGGGIRLGRDELNQSEDGRKLMEIAERRRLGIRRDFFDAMNPLDWGPDKLPFVSLFATVGKSIADAKTVSDTFEKMQKGEPVTKEALIKTQLYLQEEQERTSGTWGSTVGDIISQAPSFMAEFFASGGTLGAVRTAASKTLGKSGTESAVKALSHVGLSRVTKILGDETADDVAKATIKSYAKDILGDESAKGLAKAAGEVAANKELRKDAVKAVADAIEGSILNPEIAKVTGSSAWSAGVARKVAEARAERAVAAAMARQSSSSAVRSAVRSAGRAVADGVSRGLLDAGSWGTEASTVLFTDRSSAGRALMDAFNTFFIEAPIKGGELLLANKAVTAPISAALGGTVGRSELAIRQSAYMNNDQDLMDKANAIGLGLDFLEYVSENTGRGLKSLGRAATLKLAPGLAAPASRVSGSTGVASAKITKEASETGWKATGVEFKGLIEDGRGAETGGIIQRFVSKVLGSPEDTRSATLADRYTAVTRKLNAAGVEVTNPAALEATLREGTVQQGLDEAVANAIGRDVNAYTTTALKEAYAAKAEGLKLRCMAQYWAADYMARHQIGPRTAMNIFDQMGYDGIAGEMFEERYSDVVSALFGWGPDHREELSTRLKNAIPDWNQLTAEAVGFAFPMVARAGTLRALRAIGGGNAYTQYRETAALHQDATRHGDVGEWRVGDYIAAHQAQVDAETAKRDTAAAKRERLMAARPKGATSQWDDENIRPLDEEIATASRAIERMGTVHDEVMRVISDRKLNDDSIISVAPLSTADAELPAEEYNRRVNPTADQARQAVSAGRTLVSRAAEMGQTLAKFEMRMPEEGREWYRRAAHWITKAAGAMITGDPGLMAANPAEWQGIDVGLPGTTQDLLKKGYRQIYSAQLDRMRRAAVAEGREDAYEVDTEAAHAAALEAFRPIAEQIMASDLAAHQTLMFSDSDFIDVAMDDVARMQDLVPDAKTREYVNPETGERIAFDEFRRNHAEACEAQRKALAAEAYEIFTGGTLEKGRLRLNRRRDDALAVADVISIPKDLPTRNQAVLASLLRRMPALRNVLRVHEIDGNMSVEDQLSGMATRQAWLDRVADQILPGGLVTAASKKAAIDNVANANPIVLEAIARDLNFQYDGTEEGLAKRNRQIAEIAILSRAATNPDVRTYSRDGAMSPDDRAASPWSDFKTARRMSDGRWAYYDENDRLATANSVEEVDAAMDRGGWSQTTPRVVFTAAQALQSSTAHAMVNALGMRRTYYNASQQACGGEERYLDPMFRTSNSAEDADAIRDREARDAEIFASHAKSTNPASYLRPGEKASDPAALDRAAALMDRCKEAWYRRNDATKGYVTVANNLLRRAGVTVPFEGTGISVGTVAADLRGKYVISLNAFRSRGMSGNIYIPINHEVAENYRTALLNAALFNAYNQNRRVLADVFASGIRDFMADVDRIAASHQANAEGKNDFLAKNIADFRAATVQAKEGRVRKMSPIAFQTLTSAFALFQTEAADARAALGPFAPALVDIAKDVRKTANFQSFLAAVDRVFGGAGFNSVAVQAQGGIDSTRGVARMYSLFAPGDSESLYDALKGAVPGGLSVEEFIRRVNDADMSAFASVKPTQPRKPSGGEPVSGGTPATAVAEAIQTKLAESGVAEAHAAEAIAAVAGVATEPLPAPSPKVETALDRALRRQEELGQREAELRASMAGGETDEALLDELRLIMDERQVIGDAIADTAEAQDRAVLDATLGAADAHAGDVEDEVSEEDGYEVSDDDYAFYAVEQTSDADSRAEAVVLRDRTELTQAEIRGLVPVLARAFNALEGVDPRAEDLGPFIRKLAPGIRDRDVEAFVTTFAALDEKARKGVGEFDDVWTWPEDGSEEGTLADGHDNGNDKAVAVLSSKALGNFLAFSQLVNPHTGRQFQAFVEDLRTTVSRSLRRSETGAAAKAALEFVDSLVNPRANTAPTPALRDAYFADALARFTDKNSIPMIRGYVQTLLRGDNPVSRKAAWVLSYLAAMPANVRRQMTQLISSSAPSTPIRVRQLANPDGTVAFVVEKRTGSASRLSTAAVSSLFTAFTGKSADALRKKAVELREAAKGVDFNKTTVREAFDVYADLFAPLFGQDCPFVSALSSTDAADLAQRRYGKAILASMTAQGRLPYMIETVAHGLEFLADTVGNAEVTPEAAELCAVLTMTAGDPTRSSLSFPTNSAWATDQLATVFRCYEETMPHTIMTAEVDATRTNQPASSVAITMRGVEPAVQVFMDRTDARGFRKVCEKFFPDFARLPDAEKEAVLGRCRQKMQWPDGTGIVAKSLSKSAYSRETYAGCETNFNAGKELAKGDRSAAEKALGANGYRILSRYEDDNTFYVPVYSGDHSSSILIAVPLAKEFHKGSYESAAREVSSWVGLDLLGVDAKRSATTSLEAPGVGFIGIKRDANGDIVANEDGTPKTGECRINIVWSADGDSNESMLGTTLGTGYGIEQLKLCAKDARSATLKFHAMNTSNSGTYGAHLALIKSLNIGMAQDSLGTTGDFLECGPQKAFMDYIRKQRSSDFRDSTSILTDFDSVKLALANSKMMGVSDGKGGVIPLMTFVFGELERRIKAGEKIADSLSGDEIDKLFVTAENPDGTIEWVDKAMPSRSGRKRVSEILDGAMIERVKGLNTEDVFSLSYVDNDIMGFQVANVSHKAASTYDKTPRNYMVDALTMAQVLERGWNADASAGLKIHTNLQQVLDDLQDLVSSWGEIAVDIVSRPESVSSLLRDNEDAQAAVLRGEPAGGRFLKDIQARALSTALKKLLNVPLNGINAPLVSNMSWVQDGVVKTHAKSRMFRDTLNGSRTIRKSDREFMRGHRRMALCNVNCSDAGFRYGMYLDSAKFMQEFADEYTDIRGKDAFQRTVDLLDAVFTDLRDTEDLARTEMDEIEPVNTLKALELRRRIASCFQDHHGNYLDTRVRRFTVKNRTTGERTTAESLWYAEVSYEDLFTSLVKGADGKDTFDRTAVYENMHLDADGEGAPGRIYLGGTMMGLPRTPSYNGSQWLQTVRAALPVTEAGDGKKDWKPGYDAMVAPDPYTLKILGCDHDGDKTKLYMLHAPAVTGSANGKAKRSIRDAKRYLDMETIRVGAAGDLIERRYDPKTRTDHEWQLTPVARTQASNTFVKSLFDMSRALPVMDSSDAEVPFYHGDEITDTENQGNAANPTRAAMLPDGMWKAVKKDPAYIGPQVLDAKTGRTVGDPLTAAEVGDGAKNAADARARIVSLAAALHIAYASGLFSGTLFKADMGVDGAKRWLDFMHHVDGLSNMTFDDIKEQVCSRFGISAGMLDTVIVDLINGTGTGRLPRTDAEFDAAFKAYAKSIRDGKSRAWMSRAVDMGDFEFQAQMRQAVTGSRETPITRATMANALGLERVDGEYVPKAGATNPLAKAVAQLKDVNFGSILDECCRPHSEVLGYLAYLSQHVDDAKEFDGFEKWYATRAELKRAKAFARSVNYLTVDPSSNNATQDAGNRADGFDAVTSPEKKSNRKRIEAAGQKRIDRFLRMHNAVTRAYSLSSARTVQDYANTAAAEFDRDYTDAVMNFGGSAEEADFLAKAAGAARIATTDRLQAQANAQMVGLAVAAVNTVQPVKGSGITPENALAVLRAISQGSAESVRRGKAKVNAPLDMRRGIEDMFELMYRLVTSSTARADLPVFAFFSERPDSGARGFDRTRYYGEDPNVPTRDRGLGRITLAFQGITEGQIAEIRNLYIRTVEGRELDPDGRLGKRVNVYGGKETKYGFTLSAESLDALERSGDFRMMAGRGGNSYRSANQAQFKSLIAEARSILKALEPVLGKNVMITPSMMFGQLLPLYAAFTNRIDRTPDSRSQSIVTAMGATYSRWARELARIESTTRGARSIRMATAVNWAPRDFGAERDRIMSSGVVAPRAKSRSYNDALKTVMDRFDDKDVTAFVKSMASSVGDGAALTTPRGQALVRATRGTDVLSNPDGAYLLDPFGNNGLFSSLVSAVRGHAVEDETPSVSVSPVPVQDRDPYVEDLANRMGALLSNVSGARVEYDGGSSFVVHTRLEGSAVNGTVETAVRIDVVDRLHSDEERLALMDKPNWRRSNAARRGITVQQLEAEIASMTDAQKKAYMEEWHPVGVTHGKIGGWQVGAKELGVISGSIELERQEKHPTVVYHEYFHAVMQMAKGLGVFSKEDIAALRKKYGAAGDWFNEEPAANAFRDFVAGNTYGAPSAFSKLLDFVKALYTSIVSTGVRSSDYENDISDSPLAAMVLMGRMEKSGPKDVLAVDAAVNGGEAQEFVDVDGHLIPADEFDEIMERYREEQASLEEQTRLAEESDFDFYGTEALDVAFPDRAPGTYAPMDTYSRAVGMAIRNGMREEGLDNEASAVLNGLSGHRETWARAAEKRIAEEAVRQVAATYGVKLDNKSRKLEDLVFQALIRVNSGAQSYKTATRGPVAGNSFKATSSDLAAAILVACGTRPDHLADSVSRDIAEMRQRYGVSSFSEVLDRCEKAMDVLRASDPSELCDNADLREETIGKEIHSLEAGLLGGSLGPDGVRAPYRLAAEESSNPDARDNIATYGNHVDMNGDGNPEFQHVMRRTLDALYTTLAGMKFYRRLGFAPGGEGSVTAPADAPAPFTPDETAARLGIEARQLLERGEATDFYDQPSFVANNIESWLQSTVRNTFGKADFGDVMREGNARAAGFTRRLTQAINWQAAMLGQNVLPGQKIHAVEAIRGKFRMENGEVVRKDGGEYYRFRLYDGKRTAISLTEDEHRIVDLVLKADKAYYQGGRNAVTGVDGIVFRPDDSAEEGFYSDEEMKKRRARHDQPNAIERALMRMDLQLPGFITGDGYGLKSRFVKAATAAIFDAQHNADLKDSPALFNDYVLRRLERLGVLVAREQGVNGRHLCTEGTLVVDIDAIEDMFQASTAAKKLVQAGRKAEWLKRENRVRPLHDIYRETVQWVRDNPWLTDGDGAFFNNMRSPLAFVRGSGVFMYNANRRARGTDKSASEKMSEHEERFLTVLNQIGDNPKPLSEVSVDQLSMLADTFGTKEKDAESLRSAIAKGKYEDGDDETGLRLGRTADQRDITLAIYNRLVESMWRENGDPVIERMGGEASVARMIDMYEKSRAKDQSLTGGVGLTDEEMYRTTGVLPANHQLGHAILNQLEGITNAIAYRNTLVNMLMSPDGQGRPVMYADPNSLAAERSGIPDGVWGTIAKWWADVNGLKYDVTKTGIENAQAVYKTLHDAFSANNGKVGGAEYGELKAEDIDAKSISGILAQKDTNGNVMNALGGGYALGYAKQLMQASRHFGSTAQRAIIHRALSYSKSLSVSFSFFFPLATKWESPIGAVGAMATMGSNLSPEFARKNPELFNALQKMFGGSGWITSDFLGFKDVIAMMDSNDPFIGELVGWASALGISLSDSLINPIEPQRAILQRDLRNMTEMIRDRFGAKMAARFDSVVRPLLLRSGDKAFTYALNATKLATVAQICMKLRKEAEDNGRAFDPVRDLKRYSGYINAEIGGIDPLKYAWLHPGHRSLMSMLMFSWEWTRGAWEAGGGTAIEDLFTGGHSATAEERKYFLGRWCRMFGGVMIGIPVMFQILIKALAEALGHDDDDEKWFTWQNEDKAMWSAFDLTPLMKAVSERFPRVAQWKKDHPVLGGLLPAYTGSDRANTTGGLNNTTGKWQGRHYYMHFGKQGWEFFRWFQDPQGQFFSKLSMPTQRMLEGIFGRSLSWLDHELPWSEMGFAERWLNPSLDSATANMVKAFLPFTLTGVTDRGDAGVLSAFGPIQMGASGTATQDKLVKVLREWAFNDRRGYAPANPIAKGDKAKFHSTIAGLNSSVTSLLREAELNGATPAKAFKLVDSAVGKLTSRLYGELVEALPTTTDGDFDRAKVTKIARAINRLGRKSDALRRAVKDRFESRGIKIEKLDPRLRDRWTRILRESRIDPYGTMEGL